MDENWGYHYDLGNHLMVALTDQGGEDQNNWYDEWEGASQGFNGLIGALPMC